MKARVTRCLVISIVIFAMVLLLALWLNDPGQGLRQAAFYGDVPKVASILKTHPKVINSHRVSASMLQTQWTPSARAEARLLYWLRLKERVWALTLGRFDSQFDVWDRAGYSALDMAVTGNHPEIVSVLLQAGADPAHRSARNYSAIHQAVQYGQFETVRRFIEQKVDLEVKDFGGSTPLGWAALCDRKEIAELLLDHGAQINGGDTPPLHWAVQMKSLRMATLLVERGATKDYKDKWNRTPLSLAPATTNLCEWQTLLATH